MQYTLTVYREDDSTPWFEVGTDPSHPAPYLHEPGEIDAGEVDFLRGAATIGQVNLRVIDPQTGASQAERWLTERLGIPVGEEGEGHTALIGRRALLLRDGAVVLDGVVYSVTLSETFAGFVLEIRDIRERSRKTKLFTRTGTATILPRGVLNGYGVLPGGGFLVPPTAPLTATFFVDPGVAGFSLSRYWRGGRPLYGPDATVPPELVFTDHMAAATVVDVTGRYVNVRLLWRVAGTATWNVLDSPLGLRDLPLLNALPARLRDAGPRNGEQVQGILSILLAPGQTPLPNDGQDVEVVLVYTGPATEHYPFHFEGTAGELLKNIYDGLYSPRDADDNVIPTGVRYHEAAVLALTTPVRLRITEPVDDAREWTERFVYRAIGAAPALDSQGRIAPVLAAFPDPDAILPELTDENAQPVPGWEHLGQNAVTVVRVTYPRDYRVSEASDPLGERSDGDGIASRSITIEHRAPDWAIGLMGEQPHEIDGVIFRALGGVDGEPITGDVTDETGAQVAAQRAIETLDRWLFGGQISTCRILAAAFPGLRVGDWVIDSRSWRPNYATGQRGGPRLAQVMSVRELNPAWLEVMLVDAGPAEQPVQPPTLGALSVDNDGVVSVPVNAIPVDGEAAVYYAISPTQPQPSSSLWTFLGRTPSPAILRTPPLPSGTTVWVRARGEAAGRRPSPYTAALSIVIPATPRVHGVRVGVVDSVATVAWTPNAQTRGVRVFYAAHAPDVEPTLIDSLDVAAAEGSVVLPIRIEIGQSVTVEVEPWTGWTGAAVSGTRGSRVRAAATYDPERREPRATIRRVSSTRTSETLEYLGQLGLRGRGPLEYRRRIDEMESGPGAWGPGAGDGWAALPTPPPQEVVTRAKFWNRTVELQIRDADLQVAEARHTIAPAVPAIDPTDGTIDRSVPYNDGKWAVVAEDPAGERIAENVQDAAGRPVRNFFAKASPEQPDTADAIPDGETKRVTTIDEAEGGGRAVKGLLEDGTVAPGKVVATSIQDGAVIRQKIATGAVSAEHIQDGAVVRQKIAAGVISDEHYSSSPSDKLATVKVRMPPIVEVDVLSSTDYQITFRITARDPDGGQVRYWWRVVSTPSESYTTPEPSGVTVFYPQPLTRDVTVDRDMADLLFEAWAEDEDGNRSAIARHTIPRIAVPENALTNVNAALSLLGSTCPSVLMDRVTWTRDPDVPASWPVEVWIIEGTTTGDPFSGELLSANATSPYNTTRLTNVATGTASTYNRRYGVRLLNSRGSVIDEERPFGLSDSYNPCPE